MKFREFVHLFTDLDSPLGDLAVDITQDQEFDDAWNIDRIQQYLEFRCGYDDRCDMIRALVALYGSGIR